MDFLSSSRLECDSGVHYIIITLRFWVLLVHLRIVETVFFATIPVGTLLVSPIEQFTQYCQRSTMYGNLYFRYNYCIVH